MNFTKYGKSAVLFAGAAFIAFHLIVLGGAGAYVAHLAGFDVPFHSHHHGCISPKG